MIILALVKFHGLKEKITKTLQVLQDAIATGGDSIEKLKAS